MFAGNLYKQVLPGAPGRTSAGIPSAGRPWPALFAPGKDPSQVIYRKPEVRTKFSYQKKFIPSK